MNVEHLVECVRRHVFLYDVSHKDYKNVALKTAIWESIGKELNQNVLYHSKMTGKTSNTQTVQTNCKNTAASGEAAKSKWKTLRDGYTKYKKQQREFTPSGRKISPYAWASQLSFLDNFNTSRDTNSYTETETTSSPPPIQSPSLDFEQVLTSPPASPPRQSSYHEVHPRRSNKKREHNEVGRVVKFLNKKKKKDYDGIEHLFLSYADAFKKFPPREQALLKLELAKLFSNTELKLLQDSDDSQSQYTSTLSPAYLNIKIEENE